MAPKSAPTTTKEAKVKAPKTASPAPATPAEKPEAEGTSGRPDKKDHDAEQQQIKTEIDALQSKLSAVREKISLATKPGSGADDRRAALRSELESIRGQQSNNKASRSKIIEQLKALNDGIAKKVKDLQASKSKTPFKTVAEVDAHVKHLEKQVESGNMKLADEKRALQEISQTKRSLRLVENFQSDQESIEKDRRTAEELRAQLDDPELKAASERFDVIKAELDELKKEGDVLYAGRNKLFQERDQLQDQINSAYNRKRESSNQFREANDRYYAKLNEDRARRAERARAQRAEEEAQKKKEIAERLREEAEAPAFQAQIEDCQTLIDSLSGTVTVKSATPLSPKSDVAGVAKLELRQVEAASDGLVARTKKGEQEEPTWFAGGKGKGKGKKGGVKTATSPETNGSAPTSAALNLPLPTLSALLALAIPPPVSTADVPRVVEDLKTKKAWFEANQKRVTAENISKAEADIKRLTHAKGENTESSQTVETPATSIQDSPAVEEAKAPAEEKVEA